MNKKLIFVFLCVLMILSFFVVSCISVKGDENTDEQYLKKEMVQKNNVAKEIRQKSISYALSRSLNISVDQGDLFGSSSQLILREKEIPAMETRLRAFTADAESFIRDSSERIANEYYLVFGSDLLEKENYRLLDGVNDLYTDYLLLKYSSEIKNRIRNAVSSVKQTSLYKQWQSIYASYEAWRENTNNLATITEYKTFPKVEMHNLEDVITTLIYSKWEKELKVGEQIAKAEREAGER